MSRAVGRDAIALGKHEDVARHQRVRRDDAAMTVADHRGPFREIPAEQLDRPLGLAFLEEREPRVQDHDGDDRDRHRDPVRHRRQRGRAHRSRASGWTIWRASNPIHGRRPVRRSVFGP